MKTNSPKNTHHDHSTLESDEVWDLLSQSPTRNASANFVQNTVRAARLTEVDKTEKWRQLFKHPVFSISAITAAITMSVIVLVGGNNQDSPELVDSTNITTSEADWLNEALLTTAVEKPDLFTDAEVIAMIF